MPTTTVYGEPGTFSFTVPAGVTAIDVDVAHDAAGGTSERRQGRMTATAGEVLSIRVGNPPTTNSTWIRRGSPSGTLVVEAPGSSPGLTNATVTSWNSTNGYVSLTYDRPPNAPSQTIPPVGGAVDRDRDQRFGWVHSDPDGDAQGGYELQDRAQGDTAATTYAATTPNGWRDQPAGTLPAGEREWRVRTRSQVGPFGAWSGWRGYTAASVPSDLAITAPANGATIGDTTVTLGWSAVGQDDAEIRVVADDDGTPDGSQVLLDFGSAWGPATREVELDLSSLDSGTQVHLQVRIRYLGLWSDWASVDNLYAPFPPAVPTVLVDDTAVKGAILIGQEHPTPTGNQPAVSYAEVWRRRQHPNGTAGDPVRVTTDLDPQGTFADWSVASGADYAYQLVAVGTTGARSASGWSEHTTPVVPPPPGDVLDGGTPSSTYTDDIDGGGA